jgi:hypothetical protein
VRINQQCHRPDAEPDVGHALAVSFAIACAIACTVTLAIAELHHDHYRSARDRIQRGSALHISGGDTVELHLDGEN